MNEKSKFTHHQIIFYLCGKKGLGPSLSNNIINLVIIRLYLGYIHIYYVGVFILKGGTSYYFKNCLYNEYINLFFNLIYYYLKVVFYLKQ